MPGSPLLNSLYEKILEKIVDIFGDRAIILLDEKGRQKRKAFELFHALRRLEETLDHMGNILTRSPTPIPVDAPLRWREMVVYGFEEALGAAAQTMIDRRPIC